MLRPLSALPALVVAFASCLPGGGALRAQTAHPPSLSAHGLPGNVVTPVAGGLPAGRFFLGASGFPDFGAFWSRPDYTLGRQNNGYLAFDLYSRVSVAVRVTDLRPVEDQGIYEGMGVTGPFAFPLRGIDLSPNLQLLLAREDGWRPALAAGALDLTGTGLLTTRYLVASRTLGGWGRASVGYGVGPDLLDGAFGGVELHPTRWSVLRGEWDGDRLNAGVGLRPVLPGALGRWVTAPEVQALWARDRGWYLGASLGLPWDGDPVVRPAPSPGATVPREDAPDPWTTPSELVDLLVDDGFEHVRAAQSGAVLRLEYEDRVHTRNTMDGLVRVLDLVSARHGGNAGEVEITLLSSARPVLRVTAEAPSDPQGSAPGEWNSFRAAYPAGAQGAEEHVWPAPPAAPSRGRVDLVVRPSLLTHLAWERGLADARIGAIPTLEVPLRAGLNAALGFGIPFAQSEGMVPTKGELPDPSVAVALLSSIWNWNLSPGSALAVHLSGGRFNEEREGVRQEISLLLRGGTVRLHGDVAATRAVEGTSRSIMAVAGARVLLPGLDSRLGVSAGHFLHRDLGVTAELTRHFGDTDVTFQVKHSQHGSQGVFAVSLPLTGRRSPRPGAVRVRAPSLWRWHQSSTLFTGSINTVAFNIAQGLPARFEAWDRFQDRDRLHPVSVERALAGSGAMRREGGVP